MLRPRRQVFSLAPFQSRGRPLLYYRRFPGDYANDTRHLSFVEHGAYTLLLDYCYATEKALPKDKQEIYRKVCAKTVKERAAVDVILSEFFELRRQGYIQARVGREITRTKQKNETLRASGRKGGLKRQANAKANASRNSSKPQASQTLDSRLQTTEEESLNPTISQALGLSLFLWADYKKMRERLHRPIVQGAEDLIFKELLTFQEAGESPTAIIEQAIKTSSWKLYPVQNGDQPHESFSEKRSRKSAEAINRVVERFQEPPGPVRRTLPPTDK